MKCPYNDKIWRKWSRQIREAQPLCPECLKMGKFSPTRHVDHSKGWTSRADFFGEGRSELVPLCIPCHSQKTMLDRKEALRDNLCEMREFDI